MFGNHQTNKRPVFQLLGFLMVMLMASLQPAQSQSDVIIQQVPNIIKDSLQIDPNQGGIVIDPNAVICLSPFIKKNGKCVCPPGKVKAGNTCIKPIIACTAPLTPDGNGNCVCPPGKTKVGNTCIDQLIACIFPLVPDGNGKCVCPAGKIKVGNKCIDPNIACVAPFVPDGNGNCVCPQGKLRVGNACITPQVQCFAPLIKKNNKCVCPAGQQRVGNTCQPAPSKPQCKWPFVYKASNNSCVCARGYKLNNAGNQCIRKRATPRVSRAVVAEIQACLGLLGYDAGPADGAIGRRTRAAWSAFRIDQGLQGRPNSLADDVTQDRLFQACARARQPEPAPQPQPQPEPVPEPEDEAAEPVSQSITNFDPKKGYPEIQCASEAVAILLQGLLPQEEKIGICGEVCVPIPAGMTPVQVEGTSPSVNWCRHCTKIGENGLLCAAEHGKEEEVQQ